MDSQLALHLDHTRPVLDWSALDAEEHSVACALRWGRPNARQVREIAEEAGIGGRRVQEVIEQLIYRHGWPVGSSMAQPFGNYLIDSAAELDATETLLRTRGVSSLRRAAALRRMSVRRYFAAVQTDLETEES